MRGDRQMTRKIIAFIAAMLMMLSACMLASCEGGGSSGSGGENKGQSQDPAEASVDENGTYDSKEEVAEYLSIYRKLPKNYITKKEAKRMGWHGGSVEKYAPGKCIGGDKFGNYEGILPAGKYHECDIDTLGKKNRGAKRLIYSDDGRIYYTDDHYETFTLLYGEE